MTRLCFLVSFVLIYVNVVFSVPVEEVTVQNAILPEKPLSPLAIQNIGGLTTFYNNLKNSSQFIHKRYPDLFTPLKWHLNKDLDTHYWDVSVKCLTELNDEDINEGIESLTTLANQGSQLLLELNKDSPDVDFVIATIDIVEQLTQGKLVLLENRKCSSKDFELNDQLKVGSSILKSLVEAIRAYE